MPSARPYSATFVPAWLISHASGIAACSLVSIMIVGAIFRFPNEVLCIGSMLCATLAVFGLWRENKIVREESDNADLASLGDVLSYCTYPCPGTSLLTDLERFAGVKPEQIDALFFQTCRFSNPYLKQLGEHFSETGVRSDIKFEVLGFGSMQDAAPLQEKFPNVRLIPSREKLTTHFNLVLASGRFYLWFEPEHDDESSESYVPAKGAFLVAVDDNKIALERFYEPSANSVESEAPCFA